MAEAKEISAAHATMPVSGRKSLIVKILNCKSFAIKVLQGFCAEHMYRTRMFTYDREI